jgi:hypothetical protein
MTEKNKAFWKLHPSKQRVAVAKDVLKQLALGFYKASKGYYLVFKKVGKKKECSGKLDTLFSELKSEGASCAVCGIGSVFASMVNLGDNLTTKEAGLGFEIGSGYGIDDEIMRQKIKKVFSEQQRIMIECAFEKGNIGYKNEKDDYWIEDMPEYVDTAIKFGKKYKSDINRLKAIMNNIISNKGEFIP